MLNITRRMLLASGAGALAAPALAQGTYPNKSVRVFVPFGAGGIADVTTRIVAERLSSRLGQQFVVVNQPGPGGSAAARAALAGGADGYSLALLTNGTAVSVPLIANLQFDPLKDFVPISQLGTFDFIFATPTGSPHRTLEALLNDARARAGSLNIGTILFGSTQHLSATLLGSLARITFTHVPYRGSPDLVTGAMRGDVGLAIDGFAALSSGLTGGQLRPLATTGLRRTPYLADVPTVAEAGVPGYDVSSWNGLFAPTGTPSEITDLLATRIREVVSTDDVRRRFLELGIEAAASTAAELTARLSGDIAKWAGVIERAGIQRQ